MSSTTYAPSIDQASKLVFDENFTRLAEQMESKLKSSGVIKFVPSAGKTYHMARVGRTELVEVSTRNPDKQYDDWTVDGRKFSKRRFTKTFLIDEKDDINELLQDPTSEILMGLKYATERLVDRIAVSAAFGNVTVGAPDEAGSSISAATDGVITIDASATGVVYDTVQQFTENFINNDVPEGKWMNATLAITGSENTDLMGEVEFISNDYINASPVAGRTMSSVAGYRNAIFAGSQNGGITVLNPILPEGSTTRTCGVMLPESVLMAYEIAKLDVSKSAQKVNSNEITIDVWINAMRTEGVGVQKITTTM